MSRNSRLTKNLTLVFLGSIGSKLIGFAMLPFYTRWLSVDSYGASDMILVYSSLILGLVSFCISDSIFIFPKGETLENQKRYFSSGLFFSVISLLITGLAFYLIKLIALINNISGIFINNIWFIYGIIVSIFLQQYLQQFIRSINKMKVYSITGIVLTFANAIFSFLLIPLFGLKGFILSTILSNLIAVFYCFIFSKNYLSLRLIDFSVYKTLLTYSIPLIPNAIMWWLVSSLNRPFLESYAGLTSLGLFAVANKLPSMLNALFSVFQQAWNISVLEEFNKDGFKEFFNITLKKVFLIQIFGAFVLTVFSEALIRFLTTSDYYEAWKIIPILTLGVIFSNISAFIGTNFSASRQSKYYFYSSLWGGGASIVFTLTLVPSMGLLGACFSVIISHIVIMLVRAFYSHKYVVISDLKYYLCNLLILIFLIINISFNPYEVFKYLSSLFLFLLFMRINLPYFIDIKMMIINKFIRK